MQLRLIAGVLLLVPMLGQAAWQTVLTEKGKRVEIERSSIARDPGGAIFVRGRIVLDVAIVDLKTSATYRIIEVLNRYDCAERTYATLGRAYYKDEDDLLRRDDIRNPTDMPVHSGTGEDKVLREVCRPRSGSENLLEAQRTVDEVGKAAEDLRQANQVLFEKEMSKAAGIKPAPEPTKAGRKSGKPVKPAEANPYANIAWTYQGTGGPDNWSKIRSEYAVCASGRRQSPIDIRDGIAVDLEAVQFAYRPSLFRVVDEGHTLRVAVNGGSFSLSGKTYDLAQIRFHRVSETTVGGKAFDMEAQLMHKSDDGKLAVIAVLLEKGSENPVVQTVLNNLPLEKGGEMASPTQMMDVSSLLPDGRRYYTFIGSLTTPPCTEDVLWLVFKQPRQVSVEQLAIFQRLYPQNVRATQPSWGRIIKESR